MTRKRKHAKRTTPKARKARTTRKASRRKPRTVARKRSTSHKRRKLISAFGAETLFVPEGVSMVGTHKRRRKHSSKRRAHSKRRYMGLPAVMGKRRVHHKRRRRAYMGGIMGGKSEIIALVMQGGATLAGALAASMLGARIPLPENMAKFKPAIPLAAGVALSASKFGRKPLIRALGVGMMVAGGLSLIRSFKPDLPMLGATDEEELLGINASEEELLGAVAEQGQLMGLPAVAGEDDNDLMGTFVTSADM